MKKVAIATIALAGVLALAGCAQNGDQSAVDSLALKAASKDLPHGDHAAVSGTWTWRDGYSVLTKTTGKNDKGDYTYWKAYGFEKDGGGWKLSENNLVDSDKYTPDKTPHKATCFALAGSDFGEQQKCSQLTD